jgi:arylformamidase
VTRPTTPALITWGGDEPNEFQRQSETFLERWKDVGNGAKKWAQPGADHFNAIYGFEDPKSALCQWVLQAASEPRI